MHVKKKKRKEEPMKGFLKFIVVAFAMLTIGLKPVMLSAGTDTNVCVITEYNLNYTFNGTNCAMVAVTYPKTWPTWYFVTSTNLLLGNGGWHYANNSIVFAVSNSPAGTLPKWKKHFVKKDPLDRRFFGVSTNSIYGP